MRFNFFLYNLDTGKSFCIMIKYSILVSNWNWWDSWKFHCIVYNGSVWTEKYHIINHNILHDRMECYSSSTKSCNVFHWANILWCWIRCFFSSCFCKQSSHHTNTEIQNLNFNPFTISGS